MAAVGDLTGLDTGEHRLTPRDAVNSAWDTAASVTDETEVEESLLDIGGQEMESGLAAPCARSSGSRRPRTAAPLTRPASSREAHGSSGTDGSGDAGGDGEVQIVGLGDQESPFAEEDGPDDDDDFVRIELPVVRAGFELPELEGTLTV